MYTKLIVEQGRGIGVNVPKSMLKNASEACKTVYKEYISVCMHFSLLKVIDQDIDV